MLYVNDADRELQAAVSVNVVYHRDAMRTHTHVWAHVRGTQTHISDVLCIPLTQIRGRRCDSYPGFIAAGHLPRC